MSSTVNNPTQPYAPVRDVPVRAPRSFVPQSFGVSDPGKVRKNNEDQFLVAAMTKTLRVELSSLPQPPLQSSDDQGHIFAVADGMGGHQAGEQASALALATIEDFVRNSLRWFDDGSRAEGRVTAELHQALGQADERIFAAAAENPALRGMGTTLTLAYNLGARLYVVHVGDSRAYLLRGDDLTRITHDHSLVAQMVQSGHIAEEDAAHHPYRHVITSALGGTDRGFQVEIRRVDLAPADLLLLCTDGLTDVVTDEEIQALLRDRGADLQGACHALVALANERGGPDNVTVVLARFEEAPAAPLTSDTPA